jgi:4,5-DOPA dioxygenase extradiol
MNAIADNDFTRTLAKLGAELPRPRAVLCVSAHWLTDGPTSTGMKRPKTIHDFGGFPAELYDVRYPAPGEPSLAERVAALTGGGVDDGEWGLDHGSWSVLRHIYPQADVPVVQLSLDVRTPARRHFELGRLLAPLRDEGVLLVGSGNLVHNLRRISFQDDAPAADWAVEFDAWIKARLEERDVDALMGDLSGAPSGALAVPTREHYDPALYVLGAASERDALKFEFEGVQNGSISMRSFSLGRA